METPEKQKRSSQWVKDGPQTPDTTKDASTASSEADPESPNSVSSKSKRSKKKAITAAELEEQEEGGAPKNRIWLQYCVLVLLVAGAAVFVILFVLNRENKPGTPDGAEGGGPPVEADDDLFAPISPVSPTGPVAPVVANTKAPTKAPTMAPTKSPTKSPTKNPTKLPTKSPTQSPTAPDLQGPIVEQLQLAGIPVDTASARTSSVLNFLGREFLALANEPDIMAQFQADLPQRFALLQLELGLSNSDGQPKLATMGTHECFWEGVTCGESSTMVEKLEWGSQGFNGTIGTEIGMLPNLQFIDLSRNEIGGVIPEELYTLANLSHVYLYKNQIGGTISTNIGNLWQIHTWHTSHNQLIGSLPRELRSGDSIRPLRYLNLYSNQMSGPLPTGLRLRRLFYFDLGRNQFSGPLPEDIADKFADLRLFHVDHNRLTGQIPALYSQTGGGRVVSFAIDNNLFTGVPPVQDLPFDNILVSYTMHNNGFTAELDKDFCKQSVFEGGEMVELKADCEICTCKGVFCEELCV